MDVLTFGAPRMLKNFFDTESARTGQKRPVYEIDLQVALEELGVTMAQVRKTPRSWRRSWANFSLLSLYSSRLRVAQFIDFCILCGCDYLPKIHGVGPATAFKLVVQHGPLHGRPIGPMRCAVWSVNLEHSCMVDS